MGGESILQQIHCAYEEISSLFMQNLSNLQHVMRKTAAQRGVKWLLDNPGLLFYFIFHVQLHVRAKKYSLLHLPKSYGAFLPFCKCSVTSK